MSEKAGSQSIKPSGGIAPFGYRWQGGKLIINDSEAPVRKLIYELFLKHRRKRVVTDLLNDLGYKTRNGAKFSDTTIDRLLRDTTAKGVRIENGQTIYVEPVVSEELWERVNNLLGQRQTRLPVYLFVGLIFCDCGGQMFINNLQNYVCKDCKRKIKAEDLEDIFISQLSNIEEIFTDHSVQGIWEHLLPKEKRIIIENVLSRITVGRTDIHMEFAVPAHSFKMPPPLQQNQSADKRPAPVQTANEQPAINEPLINEIEAAGFLGISKMTLFRKRNAGEIGFYRVGFRVLYSKEKHLIPFLNRCEK